MARKPPSDLLDIVDFIRRSRAGDPFVYGTASKGLRRSTRDLAWRLHQSGHVHLVQRRDGSGVLSYVMIRSAKAPSDMIWQQLGMAAPVHRAEAG